MRQAGRGGIGLLKLQTANQDWLEKDGALSDHAVAMGEPPKNFHLPPVRLAHLHFSNPPRSVLAALNHRVVGVSYMQNSIGGSEESTACIGADANLGEHSGTQ